MTDPGLTAGEAARQLGIAVTTLRTWHQRYGLGSRGYVSGRHRRYTVEDMARLEVMRRLTSEGLPAGQAARVALGSPLVASGPEPVDGVSNDWAAPAVRGLIRATMRLDADMMADILSRSIDEHGVIPAWEQLIRPALRVLGQRQETASHLVAVEHLLSRSISQALAAIARPSGAPTRTLLACADEEQHTLPLEALSAALAEAGAGSRMLGPRTPVEAVRHAIRRTGPMVVFVWSQSAGTASPAQLIPLLEVRPRPVAIAAVGPGWDPDALPTGIARPPDLAEALALTLTAIGSR